MVRTFHEIQYVAKRKKRIKLRHVIKAISTNTACLRNYLRCKKLDVFGLNLHVQHWSVAILLQTTAAGLTAVKFHCH